MTEFPRDFGSSFIRAVNSSNSLGQVELKLGPLTAGQAAVVIDAINERREEEERIERIKRVRAIERQTVSLRRAYSRRERDRLGRAHVRNRSSGRFMRIFRRKR